MAVIGGNTISPNLIDVQLREQLGSLRVLSFVSNDNIISILNTNLISNPLFLAKWRIKRSTNPPTYHFILAENFLSAHMKIAGTGSMDLRLGISSDDISYQIISNRGTSQTSFRAEGTSSNRFISSDDDEFIAFFAFVSNASTTGEIKNVAGLCELVLPSSFEVEKLI